MECSDGSFYTGVTNDIERRQQQHNDGSASRYTRSRRPVVLRYQEELSYEEIAEITDLPLGTVKSFLHRARAEMAVLMRASGWGPGLR